MENDLKEIAYELHRMNDLLELLIKTIENK